MSADSNPDGGPGTSDEMLPEVYDELRKLAAQKLAHENPGQTLQATALVHEAYLRLVASPGRESGALLRAGGVALGGRLHLRSGAWRFIRCIGGRRCWGKSSR